jgi:hypothetical protein
MKLLLDECVTRHVKHDFAGHQVDTVEEAGFKGLENGDLLRTAAGAYQVLITVDRNIPHQQNIAGLPLQSQKTKAKLIRRFSCASFSVIKLRVVQ